MHEAYDSAEWYSAYFKRLKPYFTAIGFLLFIIGKPKGAALPCRPRLKKKRICELYI